MLKERLQVLLTKEQRARLQAESRARGVSVGELVRDAIDKQYSGPTREEKLKAWEEIKAMRGQGPELSPEKLRRASEEEALRRFHRASRS